MVLCGLCLAWPAPPEAAEGAVFTAWVNRDNGPEPGDNYDQAKAMAVDDQGNVYITGYTKGAGEYDDLDYFTVKYTPDGRRLWTQRYDGPGNGRDVPVAIAVDEGGNVFVTGASMGSGTDYDYATIKYDPDGRVLWVDRFNGPKNGEDSARAMVMDSKGNIYVTGRSWGGDITQFDYLTIKYSPDGRRLWTRRYNGPGYGWDEARALALDVRGNVYVTGSADGGLTGPDYATIKYSSKGRLLWVSSYNSPGNYIDKAEALAVDSQGNVYVAGESLRTEDWGSYDYVTVKYDAGGRFLWVRRFDGSWNNAVRGIAVDSQDKVCISVSSATIKYDGDGRRLWMRRYHQDTYSSFATAMALDGQDNVYVTGTMFMGERVYGFATSKYSPDGQSLWVRKYHEQEYYAEAEPSAIALDGRGNIYVTGSAYGWTEGGPPYQDFLTIKYSETSRTVR